MASRYKFIDLLRGLAILLMVLNHTARYWLDERSALFAYEVIYSTVTLAAPLFLFLVGFCLSLSFENALIKYRTNQRVILKYLIRGVGTIIIGYIFSLAVFGAGSVWDGRVLQAIGLSIILAIPFLYLWDRQPARKYIVALIFALPFAFWIFFQPLSSWVGSHFWLGKIFFLEFPLWPFFSLVLWGLVMGKYFVRYRNDPDKLKTWLEKMFNGGLVLVLAAFFLTYVRLIISGGRLMGFDNDSILNNCWAPGPVTSLWIAGAIFVLLPFFVFVGDKAGKFGAWLEKLGQAALFVYVLHHLIVLNLFSALFGFRAGNPIFYLMDVLMLIILLVYCSLLWMWLKKLVKENLCFPLLK